jgi:hypothetical protein
LSEAGAALDVPSPLGIPHEFKLVIETDQTIRQCQVISREENRIALPALGKCWRQDSLPAFSDSTG